MIHTQIECKHFFYSNPAVLRLEDNVFFKDSIAILTLKDINEESIYVELGEEETILLISKLTELYLIKKFRKAEK